MKYYKNMKTLLIWGFTTVVVLFFLNSIFIYAIDLPKIIKNEYMYGEKWKQLTKVVMDTLGILSLLAGIISCIMFYKSKKDFYIVLFLTLSIVGTVFIFAINEILNIEYKKIMKYSRLGVTLVVCGLITGIYCKSILEKNKENLDSNITFDQKNAIFFKYGAICGIISILISLIIAGINFYEKNFRFEFLGYDFTNIIIYINGITMALAILNLLFFILYLTTKKRWTITTGLVMLIILWSFETGPISVISCVFLMVGIVSSSRNKRNEKNNDTYLNKEENKENIE
ncbi:hypothetical protein [Spiroplasma tabanidicola]|uniref:Uncharacterized protein n=1 Tax=Spiroplasma tabanidicola TaxID=324079 RepID=A0A6I6C9E4_9MOLU|nr:hypothetical protein [Spiroplasma tabanidicola]QGS51535.1 hypothetical protein STABA_v1c01680 [Spiroplasma tabanidicola]